MIIGAINPFIPPPFCRERRSALGQARDPRVYLSGLPDSKTSRRYIDLAQMGSLLKPARRIYLAARRCDRIALLV
jgi:hypothetical protein